MDSCYEYNKRLLANEIERIFEFHFGDNAAVDVSQSSEARAYHESHRATESTAGAQNNCRFGYHLGIFIEIAGGATV